MANADDQEKLQAELDGHNYELDTTFMDPAAVTASMLSAAIQPFREITRILTERGEMKTLERQYRLMITRLKGGPHVALQATLFESLAEVYRLLGHDTAAEAALEQAKQLKGEPPAS